MVNTIKSTSQRINKSTIFTLLCILLLASCTKSSINLEESAYEEKYFDLQKYFEQEVTDIKLKNFQFLKKITLNDRTEEQQFDTLNIEEELNIFIKNNINRPSLIGRYEVDSILNDQQQLNALNYRTLDEKLPVKTLNIQFDEQQKVTQLELKTTNQSRLIDTYSKAIYQPNKGYTINNHQEILLFGAQDMEIEVAYFK
ncbi:MAG: hypothetical protein AAGG68_14620 [Bacteroidota bacterium]